MGLLTTGQPERCHRATNARTKKKKLRFGTCAALPLQGWAQAAKNTPAQPTQKKKAQGYFELQPEMPQHHQHTQHFEKMKTLKTFQKLNDEDTIDTLN